MKWYLNLIFAFTFVVLGSCQKAEDEYLTISNLIYEVNELNNVAINDSLKATLFSFSLMVQNPENLELKDIVVDYEFNYYEFGALIPANYNINQNTVSCSFPLHFGRFPKVDVYFRLTAENESQSNMLFLTIPRPDGAN